MVPIIITMKCSVNFSLFCYIYYVIIVPLPTVRLYPLCHIKFLYKSENLRKQFLSVCNLMEEYFEKIQ